MFKIDFIVSDSFYGDEYHPRMKGKAKYTYKFDSKARAWDFFKDSISEYYGGKDFWTNFDWDGKYVDSVHFDEEGMNLLRLYKWKGFDNDIKLTWEYKGNKYLSHADLCKAYPEFGGCSVDDKPWIIPKGHNDGEEVAKLSIELSPEIDAELQQINKSKKDLLTERQEEELPFNLL